jgi:hypothetical protein
VSKKKENRNFKLYFEKNKNNKSRNTYHGKFGNFIRKKFEEKKKSNSTPRSKIMKILPN